MSRGNWQTEKQKMPLKSGNTTTDKINNYIQVWESRCYSEGLPDEIPALLAATLRVPSYKAIAVAILRNNVNEVGYSVGTTDICEQLRRSQLNQRTLF